MSANKGSEDWVYTLASATVLPVGIGAYQAADSRGWLPHEEDSVITGQANWFLGESKDCMSYPLDLKSARDRGPQTSNLTESVQVSWGWTILMPARVRRCVECSKCLTRYLIASSPYPNRSYLIPTAPYLSEEYTLYCSCRKPAVASRWRWSELKTYEVAKEAHLRGYGTPAEIVPINSQGHDAWVSDATRYLNVK
jgi:hypothetical protein